MNTGTRLLLLLLLTSSAGFRTVPPNLWSPVQERCQQQWIYRESSKTLTGRVVFHASSDDLCGLVATASVTLVKISATDTLRVLDLCYVGKPIPKGVTVTIQPLKAATFKVDFPDDPLVCSLKSTCFGTVKVAP